MLFIKVFVSTVYLVGGLLLIVFTSSINASSGELVDEFKFIDVQPIHRAPPVYPTSQRRKQNDGLVELIFMVDEKGSTFEPVVLRSSHKSFESVALYALTKYQYSPRIVNGKAVESVQSIRIIFQMENSRNFVSNDFVELYQSSIKTLEEEPVDLIKASSLISKMESNKHLNRFSLVHLFLVKFKYVNKFGTNNEKIEAIKQLLVFERWATESKGKVLDNSLAVLVRRNLVNLYIETQRYGDALLAMLNLENIDPYAKAAYSESKAKMHEIYYNDQLVSTNIVLTERGYVSVILFKRNFTFSNIEGQIRTVKLRCRNKFTELHFNPESDYKIPKSWGTCHIQVIGEVGTSAQLVQY